jgi:hypothetical protein
MTNPILKGIFYVGVIAFFLVLIDSCTKQPQSTVTKGNDIQVEFMFEQDSVKVYRFMDNGYYHYFTTRGQTMTTRHQGETTYEENIN